LTTGSKDRKREKAKKKPIASVQGSQAVTEIASTVRTAFKCAVPVLIVYFGVFRTVSMLAGKETGANILVSILGSFKTPCSLSLVAGAGGVFYGTRQKRLKERAIEDLAPYAERYEKENDPDRESSGLTPLGRTPPEEEI
jgi:hypothetical protein